MDNSLKLLRICVLGAGSWGTALARLLTIKGHIVKLWAYETEVVEGINEKHRNPLYLSEIELPEKLTATSDLTTALDNAQMIVSVIPSHAISNIFKKATPCIPDDSIIVSCSKGLEPSTGRRISQIFSEVIPDINAGRITFLSGPSFAIEVARDLPTSVVIAGTDLKTTKFVQDAFRTDRFLTFTHTDVTGIELGGAIKNVIAIASGISDGLGFGSNSRAALITRGLYEMIKIGKKLGANPLTFSGLTGMGDLILTCTSTTSRNYSLGLRIGRGEKLNDILKGMKMVAEGVKTTEAIYKIITSHNITAPICEEMYNMLYKNKSPRQSADDLTGMDLHAEMREL